MKTGAKILLGCLAAPFVLLLVLAVLALAFRAAPLPDSTRASADLEQPIATVTAEQLAAEGLQSAEGVPVGRAMPVKMVLEEGSFTIKAGPPGSAIRVEGDYDEAMYELSQDMIRGDDGAPEYSLAFLPRFSMVRRLLSQGIVEVDENTNRLTIYLPRGVPMALDLQVRKGASRLYAGGLALQRANLNLEMGEHAVYVEEPNPIEMSSLDLNVGLGEVRLEDIGNLRSESITLFGKMGEIRLNMGSGVLRDTTLFTKMRMGEMRVGLPRSARTVGTSSVFLGEVRGSPNNEGDPEGGEAHTITVKSSISFGELSYQRY